jgi:hypothetical protein
MDKSKPKKAANGKTYCNECGEQVVFMWKNKPNYCAMCGVPLDWSGDEDPKAQLRAAIEMADRTQSLLVKIETAAARKILEALEKAEEAEKAISEAPELPPEFAEVHA